LIELMRVVKQCIGLSSAGENTMFTIYTNYTCLIISVLHHLFA